MGRPATTSAVYVPMDVVKACMETSVRKVGTFNIRKLLLMSMQHISVIEFSVKIWTGMIDLFEFFDVVSDVFLHQLINVIFQINNIILNLYLNKKKRYTKGRDYLTPFNFYLISFKFVLEKEKCWINMTILKSDDDTWAISFNYCRMSKWILW